MFVDLYKPVSILLARWVAFTIEAPVQSSITAKLWLTDSYFKFRFYVKDPNNRKAGIISMALFLGLFGEIRLYLLICKFYRYYYNLMSSFCKCGSMIVILYKSFRFSWFPISGWYWSNFRWFPAFLKIQLPVGIEYLLKWWCYSDSTSGFVIFLILCFIIFPVLHQLWRNK